MTRQCIRKDCINHNNNVAEIKYPNGCRALSKLYKRDFQCQFYKEAKANDNKRDSGTDEYIY